VKTISLIQPWATLIAISAKRIETRSWYTSYRGPLAIHSSKGFPKWAREFTMEPVCYNAVKAQSGGGSNNWGQRVPAYPLGMVLATCRLVDCVSTETLKGEATCQNCKGTGTVDKWQDGQPGQEYCSWCDGNCMVCVPGGKLMEPERSFGDYEIGRYAWMLDDIVPLPQPIPAKGALGLWEWAETDIAALIAERGRGDKPCM